MENHTIDIVLWDGCIQHVYRNLKTLRYNFEGESIRYKYVEPEYYEFVIKINNTEIENKSSFIPQIRRMDDHVVKGFYNELTLFPFIRKLLSG